MVSAVDDMRVFDRSRRRAGALNENFLAEWCAAQLADRLKDIRRTFPVALSIGFPATLFPTTLIAQNLNENLLKNMNGFRVCADEEFLPFRKHSLDLVMCNFNLHAVNDLPGALLQIRQALKPDGLFLAAMPGGETLRELRESLMRAELELKGGASPRVFPFAGARQMGALMQRAGFALPVVDSENLVVTYPDMFGLMRDLRFMGEGNVIARRSRSYPGRDFFAKAAAHYAGNFSEPDGRIRAGFEIIFLIGWAPHESQQQPLRPGSAKTRLAEVLETDEIGAGDAALP